MKGDYSLVVLSFETPSFLTYRSCKLEVVDFRDAHHNFWNVWAGTVDGVCSPGVIRETQPVVYLPVRQGKQVLTVMMNLSLNSRQLCKYLKYFQWWAEQRKDECNCSVKSWSLGPFLYITP